MIGYVYTLSCSRTGQVFYIGCTTQSLKVRLGAHLSNRKSSAIGIYHYLRVNNIDPCIEIVETLECKFRSELLAQEEFWIEQFRQWGFQLQNQSNNTPYKIRERDERGSGSMKVDAKVLQEAKSYCKGHGIKLKWFINEALKEKLHLDTIQK